MYLSTQCDAVTTHCGATNVPPQKPNEPRINIACQGQSPAEALVPPTIRVFGLSPQEPKNNKVRLCTIRTILCKNHINNILVLTIKMFKNLNLIQKNRTRSIETKKKNEKMRILSLLYTTQICKAFSSFVKRNSLLCVTRRRTS